MVDRTIEADSLFDAIEEIRQQRDTGDLQSEEFRELLVELNQSWLTPEMTTTEWSPTERDRTDRDPRYDESHSGWSGRSRPAPESEASDRAFVRNFEWQYRYQSASWEMEIPKRLYRYYAERYRTRLFATYVADPFDRGLIEDIIDRLETFCDRHSVPEDQLHRVALKFVQHLEYASDEVTQGELEYPKFPLETLLHEGGDCEDSSILLGAILRELGYDVAILVLPRKQHMMLGVSLTSTDGATVEQDGTEYTLVETTNPGWDYGKIPPRYNSASVRAYPVNDQPVLVHEWNASPTGTGKIEVEGTVANFGSAPASRVTGVLYFEIDNRRAVSRDAVCQLSSLYRGNSEGFTDVIPEPRGSGDVRGRLKLSVEGSLHDMSTSFFR